MSHLLAPEDERSLTVFLCETVGAKLLLSDLTTAGEPRIAADPLAALPQALPGPAVFGDRAVRSLMFWLPQVGPIRTLADARPSTPRDKVAMRLSEISAGDRVADLIDLERTPVLVLNRSKLLSPHRLAPGELSTRSLRTTALSGETRAAYAKTRRWLINRAVRTDPFDHCPEVAHLRPKSLTRLLCWVQPEAWRRVQAGSEIWPWSG